MVAGGLHSLCIGCIPLNHKYVIMEIFGPPAAVATITDLDANRQPQRAHAVTLPWSYNTTTTQPAVFVDIAGTWSRTRDRWTA